MANRTRRPGEPRHELAGGLFLGFWVFALVVLSVAVTLLALVALTGSLR